MPLRQSGSLGSSTWITLILAAGLAGCGVESSNDFQEYGNLGTAESKGATASGDNQPPESPATGQSTFASSALSQPPVIAPVPEMNKARSATASQDEITTTAVVAPIPATVDGRLPSALIVTRATADASPREVKVLVAERDFKVEGPDGALRVSYDDIDLLKVINMEPVTADAPEFMPEWLRQLDGKRIRIRGFMFPAFEQTGLRAFQLARDNQICCFVRKPKIYDVFLVRMKSGQTTDYIQARPFDVVGTFHIDVQEEDGLLLQLYRIDDAIVIDK